MDETKTSTFFVRNQQKIAIAIGYLLVFLLAFGLGRITNSIPNPPEIRIEEPTALQPNNTPNVAGTQTESVESSSQESLPATTGTNLTPVDGQCAGKIKGNIGSSEKIYHLPGGSFYDRTNAEECFNSETDAKAAGYRKSSR